jgi:N-acetylmuramic acid 6-phosphate etherase
MLLEPKVDHLLTEARNPASTKLDELTPLELARLMNAEDACVIPAVGSQVEVIARAIDVIADRLRAGGRLVYVGAGTSGRLGVLDATECPPTFNTPPGQVVGVIAGGHEALTRSVEGAEDHPEYGLRDLEALRITSRDVVVGIATSGRTPYVLGAVSYARQQGVFTIGIACNANADLNPAVDLAITLLVGPEVLSGSTRLKAGTATKLVLNMLSTGAMVRLGKTYGNLMVDLRATNSKLRARTNRIVRGLTGLSRQEADQLLKRCDGDLKTALVARLRGVEPEEARARLAAANGQVRQALGTVHDSTSARPGFEPTCDLALGIDGGGTRTAALLAKAAPGGWTVLGRGVAGPSNLHAVGTSLALAALDDAVESAFAAAGLKRGSVASACLGLAGAGRPEEQAVIRAWAEQTRLAAHIELTSDAAILLAAGTQEGWGLVLIAGTGSIALGRTRDGRSGRSGGWGYRAYALVLAGLQAAARAADGRGPATLLTEQFLKQFSLSRPQELIQAVYDGGRDRAALASLAPLMVEAAEGDTVAAEIVEHGARELGLAAAAVARQLQWTLPIPLALAGGLLLGSPPYRQKVLNALEALGVRHNAVALIEEPAQGALRCAFTHCLQGLDKLETREVAEQHPGGVAVLPTSAPVQ